MKPTWILAALSLVSCLPATGATPLTQEESRHCAPSAPDALGFKHDDWSRLLAVAGEPQLRPHPTDLIAYRVAVYEHGNDEVRRPFNPLLAVVRVEREGGARPRMVVFRGNPAERHESWISESAWSQVDTCWKRYPPPRLGVGCRQSMRGMEVGISDWVLVEEVRGGGYQVVDFVYRDLFHKPTKEEPVEAPDASTRSPVLPAEETNLTWLREEQGVHAEPLPWLGGAVQCTQLMMHLADR